jgi:hypothetical protein
LNIKAQGILNAAKWIEESYGQAALRDVIRSCSQEVRDRYTSAIAINWHPVEEFIELVEIADRTLGRGDGKVAEEIGAAGARANMKGVFVRFAVYVATPELLMKRAAGLWRQFNDEGAMSVVSMDETSVRLEVTGVTTPNWMFDCTITGWMREVAAAMGMRAASARHTMCRAKGDPRCLWDARGIRIDPPPSPSTRPPRMR